MADNRTNQLCLHCGLCCNGVIFADGLLQPEDDEARLKSLGLTLLSQNQTGAAKTEIAQARNKNRSRKFLQPCTAFKDCRCSIYENRPRYCREFKCRLLQRAGDGRIAIGAAERIVQDAKLRVKKVKRLLGELGDTDESTALSIRFRRVRKRMETSRLDEENADLYGQLTLAVHDLNVLLSSAFYPGS